MTSAAKTLVVELDSETIKAEEEPDLTHGLASAALKMPLIMFACLSASWMLVAAWSSTSEQVCRSSWIESCVQNKT